MQFPVYVGWGSWQVHPHFLFESLGYLAAFLIGLRRKNTASYLTIEQKTSVWAGALVGAVLGAKLLVLLQHSHLLSTNRQEWLLVGLQGKTIVGALLGGWLGVEWTKKHLGMTQSTGDGFVWPLWVGTLLGRVGCFLTGLDDHTYGVATHLPWGIDFGDGIPRHPMPLYEMIFLLCWGGVLRFGPSSAMPGQLFRRYLGGYLGFRLLIDFWKPDFRPVWGLSFIQIACILGLACLFYQTLVAKLEHSVLTILPEKTN